MRIITSVVLISSLLAITWSWENIPKIPTNRRTQFYLQDEDGGFQYGYSSDDGSNAQQISSQDNEVRGSYSYIDPDGKQVHVKYTAGVNGFIPEITIDGIPQTQFNVKTNKVAQNRGFNQAKKLSKNYDESLYSQNSDKSYKISYNTGDHQREEISDANGNVRGSYSYVDEEGFHDLSYVAGPEGYKVIGGSLAKNLKPTIDRINHPSPQQTYFSNDEPDFEVKIGGKKISTGGQHSDQLDQNQNAFFYRTEARHDSNDEKSLLVKDLESSHQSTTESDAADLETTTPFPRQFPNDQRDVNYAKYLHPTYTIITPEEGQQRSYEYGVRNAIILGYFPPKHDAKFGYIYDTQ